jgi:hypothetical protein
MRGDWVVRMMAQFVVGRVEKRRTSVLGFTRRDGVVWYCLVYIVGVGEEYFVIVIVTVTVTVIVTVLCNGGMTALGLIKRDKISSIDFI